jgi:hypothetical protein
MKNERRPQRDEIRELLRQGDPLEADRGLGADELTRMRRRIVAEAATHRTRFFRPMPAFAAAAMVVLMLVIGWEFLRSEDPVTPVESTAESDRQTRQIQFSTPGGTRIIWLLDSEFEV